MAFQKACSAEQLREGGVIGVQLGERQIAICNIAGSLHALDDVCPHRGGPLSQGALHGSEISCPWHGWTFDCSSGVNTYNPAQRQQTFPVMLAGGDILLDAG
ncbi:MAG: Rieske (2Fe-2S) protein [Acidimicrobiia bacterium]|nr:Rieske (2Fe-2S) protein [Acidimicrobiia bacterium]